MSLKYDVIVVGAGPAGSTCALFLAEKHDCNVLLIDKAKFPREKPCGGYLTSRIFQRFSYLREQIDEITEVPTYGSYFYGPNLVQLEWIKEKPVGYLALRSNFDNYLKDLAIAKGVEFMEGNKVIDVKVSKESAKILTQDGKSQIAKMIIGADGARSLIAKKSGIQETSEVTSKGLCVEQEFRVSQGFLEETFGQVRATHYLYGFGGIIGYGWIFPKKEHLNIGVGGPVSHGRELGTVFPKFFEHLKEFKLVPEALKLTGKFKAALIPTSTALYLNESCSERILVAGDALGVASSTSGEGIYQSMASGEDAAIVADQALNENRFDFEFLSKYEKVWKKDLGRELKTVGNIMQLGRSEPKEAVIQKIQNFFNKMKEEPALFELFTTTFFGIV